MDALHAAANAKALSRAFLDSLGCRHYEEFTQGVENMFTEGQNIYLLGMAEALERVQNCIIPMRSGPTRDPEGLVFATTTSRWGCSGHRNADGVML